MTGPTDTITQEQVHALLERLRHLHQLIHTARQELAPMENNLARVYKEYQAAIGHLQRESYQLQTKIAILQELLDSSHQDQEGKSATDNAGSEEIIDLTGMQIQQPHNDDDMAKDMLHEHIYMVLDNEDDELLAHLQAMCSDHATKFVDVLEQIPWGIVWTSRTTPVETPAEQYQRLTTWEQALQTHLHMLEQARERGHSDRRYGLWLQYQKGSEAWNRFLQESILRIQDGNEELHLELQRLRDRQAEMGVEHE
jgi:hypothetical protein